MKLPSVKTIVAVGGLVVDIGKWFARVLREPEETPQQRAGRDEMSRRATAAAQNAGKEKR